MERVYVGNLPPDIRIKDIDDFFRPFGKLVYIDVNNRSNPAFAFVQFDNALNAHNAVRARCGYDYEGYTLDVKLVENAVQRGFEVRNQRQHTPPPPPPMFNDFNNQNNGGGFGNNFGNNFDSFDNFGNNFGSNLNNSRNTNFMSSSFQGSMPSHNMIQYPTKSRANMATQNNMIEYPTTSRWGGPGITNRSDGFSTRSDGFSNRNDGFSNRSDGFSNRSDDFSNRSGVFSNRSGGGVSNRNGGGVSNRSGAGVSNRSGGGVSNRSGGGVSNRSGSEVTNRSGGGYNRGDGSNLGGSGSYRAGGGGNDYDTRYSDVTFEDRYTQGLSGSGRKWFNRYIRKGYTAELAREKALEHRTLPYLRDGTKLDSIPKNTVGNLPLPALETIGNKIISLFGAGGGNVDQMMSSLANVSNWSGGNFQGGFSNDFNMGAPVSRRARNRMNREAKGEEKQEMGVLEKILSEIPSLHQQYLVAKQQFSKSMGILKKLKDKKSLFPLNQKEIADQKHHTQIIREYRIWNKFTFSTQDKNKPTTTKGTKNSNNNNSEGNELARYKKLDAKKLEPTSGGDAPDQLLQKYIKLKEDLLKEATPKSDQRLKLSGAAKKRMRNLIIQVGLKEPVAKTLAILPQEKLLELILLKQKYVSKTGKPIEDEIEKIRIRRTRNTYRHAVKFLKKYENHDDLTTLTEKETALIRICLRRKRRIDEEQGIPLASTRFDHLLTDKVDLTETEKIEKNAKNLDTNIEENLKSKKNENEDNKKTDEDKEETLENDCKTMNENQDRNDLTIVDLTEDKEQENKLDDENITEEYENQNNKELTEEADNEHNTDINEDNED